MKFEDMFPNPQTEIVTPLRVVVFVEGEDAVVLMTSDLDYGLGTMLADIRRAVDAWQIHKSLESAR